MSTWRDRMTNMWCTRVPVLVVVEGDFGGDVVLVLSCGHWVRRRRGNNVGPSASCERCADRLERQSDEATSLIEGLEKAAPDLRVKGTRFTIGHVLATLRRMRPWLPSLMRREPESLEGRVGFQAAVPKIRKERSLEDLADDARGIAEALATAGTDPAE